MDTANTRAPLERRERTATAQDSYHVVIAWDLPDRHKPMDVDWFSRDEYDRFLEQL